MYYWLDQWRIYISRYTIAIEINDFQELTKNKYIVGGACKLKKVMKNVEIDFMRTSSISSKRYPTQCYATKKY